MSNLSVAIFASSFYPNLGGVEELVRQLAQAYAKRGVKAVVLTNRWPRSLPDHEVYEGIELYRLAMRVPEGSPKAHLSYHLTRRAIMRQMLSILKNHQTQAIHIQCVSTNGHYALEASRALGVPLIVTSQGERTMDAGKIYEHSEFLNSTLRLLLAEADYVTACSQNTLSDLESYSGLSFGTRGQVVYNGIEPSDFEDATAYEHPRPYILGIGRMVSQKGFDVLIRAFAKAGLADHDLLLAGDGEELQALKELVKQNKLQDRVVFVGRADRVRTVALFKGCDFFALPSRHEPMGIVNLEAMASGKAVVATRVGGVPEVVVDGETGLLVLPDDADAMAAALTTLASDTALKKRLAAAGLQRAQQFDWTRIADQYLQIYRDVLTKKTPTKKLDSRVRPRGTHAGNPTP